MTVASYLTMWSIVVVAATVTYSLYSIISRKARIQALRAELRRLETHGTAAAVNTPNPWASTSSGDPLADIRKLSEQIEKMRPTATTLPRACCPKAFEQRRLVYVEGDPHPVYFCAEHLESLKKACR